jgi:hypothetical protein
MTLSGHGGEGRDRDGAVALVGVAPSKGQNMYVPSRFTVAAEQRR